MDGNRCSFQQYFVQYKTSITGVTHPHETSLITSLEYISEQCSNYSSLFHILCSKQNLYIYTLTSFLRRSVIQSWKKWSLNTGRPLLSPMIPSMTSRTPSLRRSGRWRSFILFMPTKKMSASEACVKTWPRERAGERVAEYSFNG